VIFCVPINPFVTSGTYVPLVTKGLIVEVTRLSELNSDGQD